MAQIQLIKISLPIQEIKERKESPKWKNKADLLYWEFLGEFDDNGPTLADNQSFDLLPYNNLNIQLHKEECFLCNEGEYCASFYNLYKESNEELSETQIVEQFLNN